MHHRVHQGLSAFEWTHGWRLSVIFLDVLGGAVNMHSPGMDRHDEANVSARRLVFKLLSILIAGCLRLHPKSMASYDHT